MIIKSLLISNSASLHQFPAACRGAAKLNLSLHQSPTPLFSPSHSRSLITMATAAPTNGTPMVRSALAEVSSTGAFVRKDSSFRNFIEKGGQFEPESGRYHLYVSLACPWASRCVAVLNMKGLQDAIGLSVTHPTWQKTRPDDPKDSHQGWAFTTPGDPPVSNPEGHGSFSHDGCIPDPINHAKFVRDLYDMAGDTNGKYTVPVLWDKKEKTVVNNESSEILRMLNSAFDDFASNPSLDLYPEALRAEIDSVNKWVYHSINNGVYKCGFATSQAAYDAAFNELFTALGRVESILSKRRFLAGDVITEADIRLFVTLIRFDPVYVVYFKTDHKTIREYPALREYVQDLYSTPGIKESVNIQHIKTHYFTSHPKLNAYAIIPGGCDPWWEQPHGRHRMNKQAVAFTV